MKTEFQREYPLSDLQPADYNPRYIEEDRFQALQESIQTFGIVKPIIVNIKTGVLVAGHQRTRAMKALGMTHTPAILIENPTVRDEIRFNLMHNSIETNTSEVWIDGDLRHGYQELDPAQVRFTKNANAPVVKEIGRLYQRYGAWGSIIVDDEGTVVGNADYAVCMKLVGEKVLAYCVPKGIAEGLCETLAGDYGQYHYDTLGIKAYNQGLCQKYRLKTAESPNKSTLYERFVLPGLDRRERLVDFGAGMCAYSDALRSRGFKVLAYEPHFRAPNSHNINITRVVQQIIDLHIDIQRHGLFEHVVLDSVLNSVTSPDFEHMVLLTCNALTAKDGIFYASTRSLYEIEKRRRVTKTNRQERDIEFLDPNNYSATFRKGVWTMQHFHSKEGFTELLGRYFEEIEQVKEINAGLFASCRGPINWPREDYEKALNTEFNMVYPKGYQHNKQKGLVGEILKRLSHR